MKTVNSLIILAMAIFFLGVSLTPVISTAGSFIIDSQETWNSAVLAAETNGEEDMLYISYNIFHPTVSDLEYLSEHREIGHAVVLFDRITLERTGIQQGIPKLLIKYGGCSSHAYGYEAYRLNMLTGGGLLDTSTTEYNDEFKLIWDLDPDDPASMSGQVVSKFHHDNVELPRENPGGPILNDITGPPSTFWYNPNAYGGTCLASFINESMSAGGHDFGGTNQEVAKTGMEKWAETKGVHLSVEYHENETTAELWEIISTKAEVMVLGIPGHNTTVVGYHNYGRSTHLVATLGTMSFDVLWREFESLDPDELSTFKILNCADHPEVCTQTECSNQEWNWCTYPNPAGQCQIEECEIAPPGSSQKKFPWNLFVPAITGMGRK